MSSRKFKRSLIGLLLLAMPLGAAGCVTQGPTLGPLAIPIPVSPYFQKKKEDDYWVKKRYDRAPVLGPITPGAPAIGLDEPSDDEVMRTLERAQPVEGGVPFLHEIQRSNVHIVKEKISDYLDPPRVMPLVGPVQIHHVHYKCTVYYTEKQRVGWPLPHTLENKDGQEVVYIDHEHAHMVGNVDQGSPQ